MDAVINATQENYMAVFGDFSNYVIADRIGMTVAFIPHLFGTANGRTTTRGWYAYTDRCRFGQRRAFGVEVT
jgi:HK97 family phage major capsid protein